MNGLSSSKNEKPLDLNEYQRFTGKNDRSSRSDLDGSRFFLLGLFGETGSLLSESKKKLRDSDSYDAYQGSVLEEFGDVLWYFTSIARLNNVPLSKIAACVSGKTASQSYRIKENPATFVDLQSLSTKRDDEKRLLILATKVGQLAKNFIDEKPDSKQDTLLDDLTEIFHALIEVAAATDVNLNKAALHNMEKIRDRWKIDDEWEWGDLYDDGFDEDEQLPRRIEMVFEEKEIKGKKYVIQKCNGIRIGSPLTDNRSEQDDYRFHDVFHLAYAAILGWSPVLRALFKVKRKSCPDIDENQDGARAIIIEESISTWIFNHGPRHEFFCNVKFGSLDSRVIKAVRDIVEGYEVDSRPSWQWERAILEGFRVFREVQKHRGGTVIADLTEHSITFKEPK